MDKTDSHFERGSNYQVIHCLVLAIPSKIKPPDLLFEYEMP